MQFSTVLMLLPSVIVLLGESVGPQLPAYHLRQIDDRHTVPHLVTLRPVLDICDILGRDYNCDSTTIRLRSDYDVSRAPASIRRDSTRAKNEHVNFSS